MDVFSMVIDTRGANVPYIDLMEQLRVAGTKSHIYVTDDLRLYASQFEVSAIIDILYTNQPITPLNSFWLRAKF